MTQRILVVDDEPVVLDLLAEQLNEPRFSVLTAQNVDEALELLRRERIDLVLSDIRMAPRDGYELLREIRLLKPSIPVVLMSSFSPSGTRRAVIESGGTDFLRKPFTANQLLEILDQALGEQQDSTPM